MENLTHAGPLANLRRCCRQPGPNQDDFALTCFYLRKQRPQSVVK